MSSAEIEVILLRVLTGRCQARLPGRGGVMATTTSRMGSFYSEKFAASELRKYRKEGPIPSTRTLIEAPKAVGVEGATLLDVGGGIGAIQHELLEASIAPATSVDASAPISLRRARRATVAISASSSPAGAKFRAVVLDLHRA